jgi:general secretion pathway protein D
VAVQNSDKASEMVPVAKSPGETNVALDLDPSAISDAQGATFMLDVVLSGAQNVHSVPLQVTYDRQGLQLLNISNGDFLSQGKQVVALVHREDTSSGAVELVASRPPESEGVYGYGVVTTLTFQAKTTGRFPVRITKAAVVQQGQEQTPVSSSDTTVSVQ